MNELQCPKYNKSINKHLQIKMWKGLSGLTRRRVGAGDGIGCISLKLNQVTNELFLFRFSEYIF